MANAKISTAAITATSLAVVIIGAGTFFWVTSAGKITELGQQLETEKGKFNTLQSRSNFPSETNLQGLQERLDVVQADISAPLEALKNSQVPGESISGAAFQTEFLRTKQTLTDTCNAEGISLPENFQFGFEIYATTTPVNEDTELLTQQLSLVEDLTNILVDSRVISINAIRRMLVEKTLPPQVAAERQNPRQSGNNVNVDYFPPVPENPQSVFRSLPFIIEFESDENALRKINNTFSQVPSLEGDDESSPYFVIRALEIHNSKKELPTLDTLRQGETNNAFGQALSSASPVGSIAPIIVVGSETLRSTIRVDYVELKKTPNEEQAE